MYVYKLRNANAQLYGNIQFHLISILIFIPILLVIFIISGRMQVIVFIHRSFKKKRKTEHTNFGTINEQL